MKFKKYVDRVVTVSVVQKLVWPLLFLLWLFVKVPKSMISHLDMRQRLDTISPDYTISVLN